MNAKTSDFKLGLFVLASLGLLGAGLLAFGAVSYFQKMDMLETYLTENADGLSVGAPVTLRGVRVGKVTRIDFSWNVYQPTAPHYVIVEFEVRNRISPAVSSKAKADRVRAEVEKGLRARIKPQGFTGASMLSLEYMDPAEYPPPPFAWKPRYLCIPSAPSQFGEVLASVQKTLHNFAQLDLHAINGSLERNLGAAEKVMDQLQRDLGAAGTLIGHLDEVNYRELGTNASALITQLRTDVKEMHLPKVSDDADQVLLGLKGTLGHLDLMVANLDTGSLNDALAYARLATKDLDETLRKLKQYPAGFLLGKPPAAVRIPEKAAK